MGDLFGGLAEQGSGKVRAVGAARLREPVRDEIRLEVFDLDGLISEDHPARVIWEYARRVDLSDFEAEVKAREGTAGMPQTSPQLLLLDCRDS